eukprot:3675006-Karenia_brevis.AAC.1
MMRITGMTSNATSFSPASAACEKGGQCEHVTPQDLSPDVISFDSAIAECPKEGKQHEVVLWQSE